LLLNFHDDGDVALSLHDMLTWQLIWHLCWCLRW